MPKVNNIAAPQFTTAHAQAAELAQFAGAQPSAIDAMSSQVVAVAVESLTEELAAEKAAHSVTTGSLTTANAQVEALTAELTAEKEAHAKAQAALTAALGQ